jgi:hypothetical protein
LGGLKGTEALNMGVNLSKLKMTCEMDCTKDCMPNSDGRLRPVQMSKRTAEWGFTAEDRQRRKKKAADASERVVSAGVPTGGGSNNTAATDGSRVNAAGHRVPAWYIWTYPERFEKFTTRVAPPYELALSNEEWASFYNNYPGHDMCPTNPMHNTVAALDRMKALGMKRCPCIMGQSLKQGTVFGEDYSMVVTGADNQMLHTQWVSIENEKQKRWDSEPYEKHAETKAWGFEEKRKLRAEFLVAMQARKVAQNLLNSDAATTSASAAAPAPLAAVSEEEDVENDEESEEEGTGLECRSADSVSRAKVPCPAMGCADLICRSCANPRNIIHDGEMMTIKDGKIYYGRDHTDAPDGELEEETADEQIASLNRWHKQQDEADRVFRRVATQPPLLKRIHVPVNTR